MNLQEFKDEIVIRSMPYPNAILTEQVFEWIIHKVKKGDYGRADGVKLSAAAYVPSTKLDLSIHKNLQPFYG